MRRWFFWGCTSGVILALWTAVLAAFFYRGSLSLPMYWNPARLEWQGGWEGAWTVPIVGETVLVVWVLWTLGATSLVGIMVMQGIRHRLFQEEDSKHE